MRHGIVAVIERNERFLLIQRGPDVPFAGYWAPLSGKVETGESQAEAVARETLEEVGLVVEPLRKVWECPAEGSAEWTLHWWLARDGGGELRPDPREVADAGWYTLEEMRGLPQTFRDDLRFFESVYPTL